MNQHKVSLSSVSGNPPCDLVCEDVVKLSCFHACNFGDVGISECRRNVLSLIRISSTKGGVSESRANLMEDVQPMRHLLSTFCHSSSSSYR